MTRTCPLCQIDMPDEGAFDHLRLEHPDDNWGEFSTHNVESTVDGRVVIGVGRRVAYALCIWPLEVAPRNIIRAMLPEEGRVQRSTGQRHSGHLQATHSRTTKKFADRLYEMDSAGLIERGSRYIRIVDRDALRSRALRNVSDDRVEFLHIDRAVEPARRAVAEAKAERERQQALRDLQAIFDLMKNDAGVWHGGKSNVRHVPHGWRGRPS